MLSIDLQGAQSLLDLVHSVRGGHAPDEAELEAVLAMSLRPGARTNAAGRPSRPWLSTWRIGCCRWPTI